MLARPALCRNGAPRPMKMGTYMRLRQSRGFLRELRFLASQEACVCIHGMMVPCLAVLLQSSPNAPQGLRLWAQGLDGESTRRAIMVWAMSGARGFLSERVNLPLLLSGVLRLKLRFYLVHLIQGGALIEICGTRRINLYPVGIAPVPRSLMHRCEGKGAPRRMGPIY